jgi:hypothetical protein
MEDIHNLIGGRHFGSMEELQAVLSSTISTCKKSQREMSASPPTGGIAERC